MALFRKDENPFNKWKFLAVGFIVSMVLLISGYGVISYTNSPSFCSSCHELAPEYTTYAESAHKRISCVKCHDKPGFKNILNNKIDLSKDIYSHYNGIPKQIMQTKELAVTNDSCMQCHSKNRLVTATGDLKVNHKGHIDKEIPCITCHAGIAHSKIAERGINTSKDMKYWTKANIEKLMKEQYVRPNMGTCIDCHDKVNNGEEPWKDISYSVPKSNSELEDARISENEQDKKTQVLILEAIGKQKKKVKISMECETCHKIVKVPSSHRKIDWNHNHGNTAFYELDKCMGCHQDSKWIKEMPKEDIMSLLAESTQKVKYVPNIKQLKDQSRTNKFCSTCHSNDPPSHNANNGWAIGHAFASQEDQDKQNCFFCHDEKEPTKESLIYIKAPAVSCEYCHKNGLSGILNNKADF